MPIVNIICSICTDVFKNAGDVWSTNCGHLFHYVCFNDWMQRNRSCPQCRLINPSSHQLHLSFIEYEKINIEDMNVQIKSSEEKIAELRTQNQELSNNFLKLPEQYSLADSSNRELEIQLSQINNTEHDFLRLQAQYTDIAEIRKQFEDRINQLFIENECKIKELHLRRDENEQLKSDLDGEHFALPDNALGQKLRSIEQKLKFTTEELQKEINTSTLLSVDNMKLQSSINYHSGENKENKTPKEKGRNTRHHNIGQKHLPENTPQLKSYVNCVVIKGLPERQLNYGSLENTVINLASKMNLVLSADDFINVHIIKKKCKKSKNAALCVQFKEIEKKLAFLAYNETRQDDANAKSVIVEEFMSNEMRELFTYAKKMLHNKGLTYFCIENNNIVAKKSRISPDFLYIFNKEQVDNIARFNSKTKCGT